MSDHTAISWTEATWNPTSGCDQVSPGCDNCYALTMAKRLKAMGSPGYQRDGDPRTSGPGFGLTVHPDRLDQPLRWRKPRRIFVNSMSDLFHDEVPGDFIARVFAVMAAAPQHTFQILTKRHARMRSLLSSPWFRSTVEEFAADIAVGRRGNVVRFTWPIHNVWLGVSAEDQKWANIRGDALRATPAAVRFVSAEPLLGPIDLHLFDQEEHDGGVHPVHRVPGIDWVIVGGESGRDARPMDMRWVRGLRDQCDAAGVAFFLKQTGSVLAADWGLHHRAGAKPAEWPEPFPQDFPIGVAS